MARESIVFELGRLYDLTMRLRSECPWDRKQTQESIIAYTLEETHELADAIHNRETRGDDAVLGELGDLLFQVYFMASVAEEQDLYDLGDVATGIHAKLVRRHPHIFGDAQADTPEEVRRTWDAIKRDSEGREGIFHDVPSAFPSTLLAQKVQQRAAAVGFDWESAPDVMAKVEEETAEIAEELAAGSDPERLAAEVGDSVVLGGEPRPQAESGSGTGPAPYRSSLQGQGGGGGEIGRRRRPRLRRHGTERARVLLPTGEKGAEAMTVILGVFGRQILDSRGNPDGRGRC